LRRQLDEAETELQQALLAHEEALLAQASPLKAARQPRPSHQISEAMGRSDDACNEQEGCSGKSDHDHNNGKLKNRRCWACGQKGHVKAMCHQRQGTDASGPRDAPAAHSRRDRGKRGHPDGSSKMQDVDEVREGTPRGERSQPASGEPGQAITRRAGRREATAAEAPDTGVRDQPRRRWWTRRRRRPQGQDVDRVQDSRTISPHGGSGQGASMVAETVTF